MGDMLRKYMSRFRLSSHLLAIETGRYNGTERQHRICNLCNHNQIESEYHILLCCPAYSNIRIKYFGNIPWPNMHMFINIMSSKGRKAIFKLSHYLKEAFELRNTMC